VNVQLQLAFEEHELARPDRGSHPCDGGGNEQTTVRRPPRGITAGRVVVADGCRWINLGFDFDRGEFVVKLIGGSGVLRRFRPRAIVHVERPPKGGL
jgi:hypothetical protein